MKYKHKITGIIGSTNEKDNYLHFERCSGDVCSEESLSMVFVRESSDWIEVKETEKEYYLNENNELVIVATGEAFKDGDRVYGKNKQGKIVSGVFKGINKYVDFPINFTTDGKLVSTKGVLSNTTVIINDEKVLLSTLKKSEVLFTTDDGYDIYMEDTFYLVTDNTFNIHKQEAPAFTKKLDQHKRFKNYRSAIGYACRNKNVFSINDLDKLLVLCPTEKYKLLKFAESKIELKNF